MLQVVLLVAWSAVALGLTGGIVLGLCFHDEKWLGGYSSWPRRLLRLGHVSLFGIPLLMFGFVETVSSTGLSVADSYWSSCLFIAGAMTMPLVCLLTAFRPNLRGLFAIPIVSVLGAVLVLLLKLLQSQRQI